MGCAMMKCRCFSSAVIVLLVFTLILLATLQLATPASAEKLTLTLDLDVRTAESTSFEFYLGMGSKQNELNRSEVTSPMEAWGGYSPSIGLETYIIEKLNVSTWDEFAKTLLGCDCTAGKVIVVNYSNGIGFVGEASVGGWELRPLGFLSAREDIAAADVSINIKSPNCGIESSEFAPLHFRLVYEEILIYSSTSNELKIIDTPAFSPLGGFIILIVCTSVSVILCLYSRKYFRGEKLHAPIWVLAWVFYFCAFIPFSAYIFLSLSIVGVVISGVRVTRSILRARPKPPKKEVIKIAEAEKRVEEYLGLKKEEPKAEPVEKPLPKKKRLKLLFRRKR